jgi:hypothetical protein
MSLQARAEKILIARPAVVDAWKAKIPDADRRRISSA